VCCVLTSCPSYITYPLFPFFLPSVLSQKEIAREAQQLMDKWVVDLSGTPSAGTGGPTAVKSDSIQKGRKREREEGNHETPRTKVTKEHWDRYPLLVIVKPFCISHYILLYC